jgi:hypothetical protein
MKDHKNIFAGIFNKLNIGKKKLKKPKTVGINYFPISIFAPVYNVDVMLPKPNNCNIIKNSFFIIISIIEGIFLIVLIAVFFSLFKNPFFLYIIYNTVLRLPELISYKSNN